MIVRTVPGPVLPPGCSTRLKPSRKASVAPAGASRVAGATDPVVRLADVARVGSRDAAGASAPRHCTIVAAARVALTLRTGASPPAQPTSVALPATMLRAPAGTSAVAPAAGSIAPAANIPPRAAPVRSRSLLALVARAASGDPASGW